MSWNLLSTFPILHPGCIGTFVNVADSGFLYDKFILTTCALKILKTLLEQTFPKSIDGRISNRSFEIGLPYVHIVKRKNFKPSVSNRPTRYVHIVSFKLHKTFTLFIKHGL